MSERKDVLSRKLDPKEAGERRVVASAERQKEAREVAAEARRRVFSFADAGTRAQRPLEKSLEIRMSTSALGGADLDDELEAMGLEEEAPPRDFAEILRDCRDHGAAFEKALKEVLERAQRGTQRETKGLIALGLPEELRRIAFREDCDPAVRMLCAYHLRDMYDRCFADDAEAIGLPEFALAVLERKPFEAEDWFCEAAVACFESPLASQHVPAIVGACRALIDAEAVRGATRANACRVLRLAARRVTYFGQLELADHLKPTEATDRALAIALRETEDAYALEHIVWALVACGGWSIKLELYERISDLLQESSRLPVRVAALWYMAHLPADLADSCAVAAAEEMCGMKNRAAAMAGMTFALSLLEAGRHEELFQTDCVRAACANLSYSDDNLKVAALLLIKAAALAGHPGLLEMMQPEEDDMEAVFGVVPEDYQFEKETVERLEYYRDVPNAQIAELSREILTLLKN